MIHPNIRPCPTLGEALFRNASSIVMVYASALLSIFGKRYEAFGKLPIHVLSG